VLRAGAGMFYDKVVLGFPSIAAITTGQKLLLGFFQALKFPVDENVVEQYGVDAIRPLLFSGDTLAVRFSTGDTLDTPYTLQWNVGFERSLSYRTLFGMTYLHARGYHTPLFRDLNPVVGCVPPDASDPDTCLPTHLDPSGGSIAAIETMGNTWYDGLEMHIRRTSGRVRYNASYTYSRSIDESSDPLKGGIWLPPDSSDIPAERARSDNDQRNRLVISGTWESPLWGLQVSPLVTFATGSPFNVTLGEDANLDGFDQERPAGLGRNTGASTPINVVNQQREAWCTDVDSHGNPKEETPCLPPFTGRLTEPDFVQVDVKVAKNFGGAHADFQGYVQVINVFNHANLAGVDGAINSANFGKPLTLAGPPRIVELGLKFGF
jgi:hypothetical protein